MTGLVNGASRRVFLRNGLLIGAGAAAVGITSLSRAGTAQADVGPVQWGWAWCSKCQGLYYAANRNAPMICPAGGTHGDAPSYQYAVYYNTEGSYYFQTGWSWCAACAGLFYSGGKAAAGACPALYGRGAHVNHGSFAYAIQHDTNDFASYQDDWFWCSQCAGQFHGSNGATRAGVCPYDGSVYKHNGSTSFNYYMLD